MLEVWCSSVDRETLFVKEGPQRRLFCIGVGRGGSVFRVVIGSKQIGSNSWLGT